MLGNLIGGFVVILVGVVLAPAVADAVGGARGWNGSDYLSNLTSSGHTIMGLTTLFYVLAIASTGIGIATVGLRNSGLM